MIHENNHHYKLSINPHRVGVVLLERKDVKKSFFHYSDRGLNQLQTGGLIIFSKLIAVGGGGL